jgi:adenylate cyclase class 2
VSIEHEAKFPLADLPALETRLRTLGSLRTRWHFESNTVYDRDGELASSDRLLRLRRALVSTLTFKEPVTASETPGVKSRRERECRVEDPDGMDLILRGLGFSPRLTYEKFRAVWTVGEGTVFLDILPFGHFAEIEAPAASIPELARSLGLDPAAALDASYHALHRDWRRANGLPPQENFVFEAPERRRLTIKLGCEAPAQGEPC